MNNARIMHVEKVLNELCDFDFHSFEERCYAHWAIHEVVQKMKKYPWIPPIKIIEEFGDMSALYSGYNEIALKVFSAPCRLMEHYSDLYHAGLFKEV